VWYDESHQLTIANMQVKIIWFRNRYRLHSGRHH